MFIAHELPEEIEEVVIDAGGGPVHLPAVIAEAFGRTRERRAAGDRPGRREARRGAGRSPTSSTCPAEALDGRVLQVGKRQFRRLRVAGL